MYSFLSLEILTLSKLKISKSIHKQKIINVIRYGEIAVKKSDVLLQ